MSYKEQVLQYLGGGDIGALLNAVLAIGLAFVMSGAVYFATTFVRNHRPPDSGLRTFCVTIRLPATLLVLADVLLQNLSVIVPAKLQITIISVSSIQGLLLIGTLLWVMLRYIDHVERRLDLRALREGGVVLPLIREKVARGTLQKLFKGLRAMAVVIVSLLIIQALGVSISGLLAFGGVGGLAVGFAARDIINNMFSGLRIFWSRPFDVGDWIKCPAHDIEGVVETIGWQITQVRTFDKRPLYVPNSLLGQSVIENPQRMTNRRIYQYFGVRYDDIKVVPQVLAGIRKMLGTHKAIAADQISMVNLDRFGDFSVDFFVYCMTATTNWAEYHTVKEDILLRIAGIVEECGAEFAFPTRTVHVDPGQTTRQELDRASAAGE